MSNYYGFSLWAKSRKEGLMIADRAIELQKELRTTTDETTDFRFCESENGECGISYGTYSGELGELALKVVEGIAATFPEMKLHLYQTWNGPVYAEAISVNGEMMELEQAKDENGEPICDEDENAISINLSDPSAASV